MAAIVWIFIIVLVVSAVVIASYYTNDVKTLAESGVEKAKSIYTEHKKVDPDGSEIVLQIPTPPEVEDEVPEIINEDNYTQAIEVEEDRIQVCYKLDPNGCKIQGTAKMINPVTQQVITPYFYEYYLTIECAQIVDGFDYCNENQRLYRGVTEDAGLDPDGNILGGRYKEVWHPRHDTFSGLKSGGEILQKGLYDVKVFVKSDLQDNTGRYEEIWHVFQIELKDG